MNKLWQSSKTVKPDDPVGRYLAWRAGLTSYPSCLRTVLPGTIARGSAIRLAPAGDALGIAEGIETALSASAWASGRE